MNPCIPPALIRHYTRGEYYITTDPAQMDARAVFDYLSRSYWASNRSFDMVEVSMSHSFCFGVFHATRQIGFARLVTDYATAAYLADVYILEEYRGRGLGKWLIEVVTGVPELQGLRRWILATRDAHELYRAFGFTELEHPERYMERLHPDSEPR